MSTNYYLEGRSLVSKPLLPGTEAYEIAARFLGLTNPTLADLQAGFEDEGWNFMFAGDKIIDLEPDDDQEIPPPINLDELAGVFVDGSYIEYSEGDDFTRKVFRGGDTEEFGKLDWLPAEAYTDRAGLEAHIVEVEAYLTALRLHLETSF